MKLSSSFVAIVALAVLLISSSDGKHASSKRRANSAGTSTDVELSPRSAWNTPDHPDWYYLNAKQWWQIDPTQQDHARFHAYLSMAAYGAFKTLCPKTFTQGFTVLSEFNTQTGQSGYIAKVPEMKKIIIVFKGYTSALSQTPVSLSSLVSDCGDCTVSKGVYDLYMSAKTATNDFEVAKDAVKSTGLLFSVTGHGMGGSVAALAGLDLGARNLVHYSHNQGAPRALNYAAVVRYDNLFQVLAGQSLVARNDPSPHSIPEGTYYHVGQKVHITGDKTQWLVNCYGNNENATCLGTGDTPSDHKYYFTPLGECGSANKGF